jgi:tetratricopeptide (TPR) repeat protein
LLLKVLEITQNEIKAQDYAALTYLNLSAVYSELGKHRKSIFFANKAIQVLTIEIEDLRKKEIELGKPSKYQEKEINDEDNISGISPAKPINEDQNEEERKIIASKREKTSLLAIAYYNQGSQLEFEKQHKECIESFRQAISILENNFAPNYPLTIEFKNTLSKAIQKYQTHITWKGYNRTFSNLNEGFVSKRVSSVVPRPTSAKSSKTRISQPFQGRTKSLKSGKSRPFTATNKQIDLKRNLDDSLLHPFGSPEDEEMIFTLDENKNQENSKNQVLSQTQLNDIFKKDRTKNTIESKIPEDSKISSVSPVNEASKRFKRPQSAKTAFMSKTGRFSRKRNEGDYAMLELGKIFNANNKV